MQLPALKNAVPASLIDGQSIEDFIRNSTQNLQRMAAAMPGSGVAGAVYLGFDGTNGVGSSTGRWSTRKVSAASWCRSTACSRAASSGPTRRRCRRYSGSCSASTTTSRCPSSCCRSRCRPTPTERKPTARRYVLGFVGFMLDDGANVVFEHYSMGAKKAVNALATAATQALAAFGEIVHPVIELGSSSYENSYRTIHDPKLNVIGYVTDKRAREADVISDDDIITRPTASRAKLRRETKEAPAL